MLPKKRRISKDKFTYILKEGVRYNSPLFLMYKTPILNKSEESRVSFSVSKKISKKAVIRNRYRRRGYSAIKDFIHSVERGYFLFFSFKKTSKEPSFKEIRENIYKLLLESSVLS